MKTTTEQRAKWSRIAESRLDVRSNLERQGRISREAIPALLADLEEARIRIHDLETICDPAGLTIENAQSKDQLAALQIMYRNAADDLAATRKQLAEAQAENAAMHSAAHRLALEAECFYMDCKDMALVSKWDDPLQTAISDVQSLQWSGDTSALSSAIAEAVEPYKLDAERYQQRRLNRRGARKVTT